MSGRLAFTFARMNPPTVGHERLLGCLKKMFWAHDRYLFLSGTENDKNPLSFDYKYELCKSAFQDIDLIVSKHSQKDFFAAIKWVAEIGYADIDILVGSDRFDELNKRVHMYNGSLYNFRDITVHKIDRGTGDEVSNMSATKMREAVKLGDYDFFENGLPSKLRPRSREIFEEVRKGCLVST